VTAQAVSKWETGISCPDISLLAPLADAFGTTIDELLRGGGEQGARQLPEGERKSLDKLLLRIYVNSQKGDVVKVNLPLTMVKAAFELGVVSPEMMNISSGKGRNLLKTIDIDAIMKLAENGAVGKLLEVKSEDGDIVEISIE